MEYCITVFRKDLNPSSAFHAPDVVSTAFGKATKADDYGRLYWKKSMYIQYVPSIQYLLNQLPQQCSRQDWICLKIGNSEAMMSNFNITYDASSMQGAADAAQELGLVSLLDVLLHDQSSWAVFFEKNCDQIIEVSVSSLSKLLRDVNDVYTNTGRLAQGFGAYYCSE